MYARESDIRDTLYKTVLAMSQEYETETVETIRRIDMLRHDFYVRPPPKSLAGAQGFASRGMNMLGAMLFGAGR